MGLEAKSHRNRCPADDQEEYTFTIQPVSFNLMAGVAKLSDSPVISNIYIRDNDLKGTISDDERQTEQDNANHAKSLTEQSDEPSGMELLTQIAQRFSGLKCSTSVTVLVAGQEIILFIPDCVAATAPREIVLDGVPVMWPWDWDVSEELLEMARWDDAVYGFQIGGNVCLFHNRHGTGTPVEIIGKLKAANTSAA